MCRGAATLYSNTVSVHNDEHCDISQRHGGGSAQKGRGTEARRGRRIRQGCARKIEWKGKGDEGSVV
jgi:hypothetical protein